MAQIQTYHTKDFTGKPVLGAGPDGARLGKVARFVFHPAQKRCLGFIVKRPDLALMFHRPDLFVPVGAFTLDEEGNVCITTSSKDAIGTAAVRRLGVDWDMCVMWEGMPLIKEAGEDLGHVGSVEFDRATGKVVSVQAERGATAKTLLGQLVIPAKDIQGFKLGIGTELSEEWAETEDGEAEPLRGAIMVSDVVDLAHTEGGIAEAAGQGAALAQDKVRRAVGSVKPKAAEVAKKTGEAVNKGAFVTGRQLGRAKGMFASFKEEYDKASGKQATKKRK